MYINPKHIILAMGIVIILMMMYIIHLLRNPVNAQQPVIIIPGNPDQSHKNQIPVVQDHQIIGRSNFMGGLQSDFFKKSLQFSTDYLMNRSGVIDINSLPMDSQQVLSSISMLSDTVKQNMITAINYFSVDVANAANIENRLRVASSENKMPLWIVILREGASRVVPSFNLINDNNFNPNFIDQGNLTVLKKIS